MTRSNPASRWTPVLQLLPLLALYLGFVLFKAKPDFSGDEGRYILGAGNLLKGRFATEETLFLWNGPGYPLYLAPFLALGIPLIAAKLGNAVFLFLALVRFHGALGLLPARRGALAMAYGLGLLLFLHGPALELLMTESLCAFLVCGAAYHYLAGLRPPAPGGRPFLHPALAGLHLGYLALTKVFFGYALLAGLAACAAWWALRRLRPAAGNAGAGEAAMPGMPPAEATRRAAWGGMLACGTALALCLPYLAYTFKLTGKPFYWSNSGGSQLYCMTLLDEELLGDWLNFDAVLTFPDFFAGQAGFYRELARMDYVSRDGAMKAAALRNIKANPRKYFRNWRANVNRMVFGYPNSRYPGSDAELATGNRSFVYALPFFLLAFAAPAGLARRRDIAPGVHACLAFALIALGGLSLLSAFPRMVFPLLPLPALWMAAAWSAGREGGREDGRADRGIRR